MSKKTTLTFHLSKAEANRFRNRRIAGLLFLLGALATLFSPVYAHLTDSHIGIAIIAGIVELLVGLVILTQIEPLRPSAFGDGWMTVKGCSREFLDSIAPL